MISNKLKHTLLASLLATIVVNTANAAGPVLLQDANTSSAANQTNLNFGGNPSLNVAAGKNSFLKFAVTSFFPLGTTGNDVAKATLKLFVNSVKGNGSFSVYTAGASWTESGITNNNQPSVGALVAGPFAISSSSNQQFVTIDITNQVKDWLDNVSNNNGLILTTTDGLSVFFDSKENTTSSHAPEIEISLAGIPGPKGDKGDKGLQGIKGDTGATGAQGPKGDTGATGAQGPKGDTGATGLQAISASAGQTLIWNGTQWQAGTAIVGLNGDVTGTSSDNTVQKIQGNPIASTLPVVGQSLVWDGTQWAPSSSATYRFASFHTYDPAGAWITNETMMGGVYPSAWTMANATASMISGDKEILRTLFTKKGYATKNALIVSDVYVSPPVQSSRPTIDGLVALALFRIKNNTSSPITWTPNFIYTCYGDRGQSASAALNGLSVFSTGISGSCNAGGSNSNVTLTIPAYRVSTVIFVSTGNPPANGYRSTILGFGNNSLALPDGLMYVDDLDTAFGGWGG